MTASDSVARVKLQLRLTGRPNVSTLTKRTDYILTFTVIVLFVAYRRMVWFPAAVTWLARLRVAQDVRTVMYSETIISAGEQALTSTGPSAIVLLHRAYLWWVKLVTASTVWKNVSIKRVKGY